VDVLVHGVGIESKVATKLNKVVSGKGFGQNVCDIVNGADLGDCQLVVSY
jgi:hypothetical protein